MKKLTKKDVKEMLLGFHNGKIVDIDIYFNRYTQLYQATVIIVTKFHLVEQFVVDESGYIYFDFMTNADNGHTVRNSIK